MPFGFGVPPSGMHPRPRRREAVGLQAQRLHQRDVLGAAVVVVAGDVAVVAVHDGTGDPAERVPDRVGPAVLVGGALDLVGGGRRPAQEVRGEWSTRWCSSLDRSWHDAGDELPAGERRTGAAAGWWPAPRRRARSSSRRSSSACSSCSATGRVGLAGSSTMNGQKKLVQVATKVNRTSIAAAGRAAGTPTCQKVRIIEAPSMRAASISSSGTACWRYWVIQNTPNAVTTPGMMTAQRAGPAQLGDQDVQRHDAELRRHRHGGDDEDQQPLAAAEAQLGEGEAGEGGEDDDGYGRHAGDDEAVAQRLPERDAVDDRAALARKLPPGSSGMSRLRTVLSWLPDEERPVEGEERTRAGRRRGSRRSGSRAGGRRRSPSAPVAGPPPCRGAGGALACALFDHGDGAHLRPPWLAMRRVTTKLSSAMSMMIRKSIQATAAARPKFRWPQPSS